MRVALYSVLLLLLVVGAACQQAAPQQQQQQQQPVTAVQQQPAQQPQQQPVAVQQQQPVVQQQPVQQQQQQPQQAQPLQQQGQQQDEQQGLTKAKEPAVLTNKTAAKQDFTGLSKTNSLYDNLMRIDNATLFGLGVAYAPIFKDLGDQLKATGRSAAPQTGTPTPEQQRGESVGGGPFTLFVPENCALVKSINREKVLLGRANVPTDQLIYDSKIMKGIQNQAMYHVAKGNYPLSGLANTSDIFLPTLFTDDKFVKLGKTNNVSNPQVIRLHKGPLNYDMKWMNVTNQLNLGGNASTVAPTSGGTTTTNQTMQPPAVATNTTGTQQQAKFVWLQAQPATQQQQQPVQQQPAQQQQQPAQQQQPVQQQNATIAPAGVANVTAVGGDYGWKIMWLTNQKVRSTYSPQFIAKQQYWPFVLGEFSRNASEVNVESSNGVLHLIHDTIEIPGKTTEMLQSANLSGFYSLIEAAGLSQLFNNANASTILAPSNDAINNLQQQWDQLQKQAPQQPVTQQTQPATQQAQPATQPVQQQQQPAAQPTQPATQQAQPAAGFVHLQAAQQPVATTTTNATTVQQTTQPVQQTQPAQQTQPVQQAQQPVAQQQQQQQQQQQAMSAPLNAPFFNMKLTRGQIIDILRMHLLSGVQYSSGLNKTKSLTTISGVPIGINAAGNTYTFNVLQQPQPVQPATTQPQSPGAATNTTGAAPTAQTTGGVMNATLLFPDILTRNGVVHVIDRVLFPPGMIGFGNAGAVMGGGTAGAGGLKASQRFCDSLAATNAAAQTQPVAPATGQTVATNTTTTNTTVAPAQQQRFVSSFRALYRHLQAQQQQQPAQTTTVQQNTTTVQQQQPMQGQQQQPQPMQGQQQQGQMQPMMAGQDQATPQCPANNRLCFVVRDLPQICNNVASSGDENLFTQQLLNAKPEPQCYDPNTHVCTNQVFLCPTSHPHYCSGLCYSTAQYSCENNFFLCPKTAPQRCGNACYDPTLYQCTNNKLTQVPNAEQALKQKQQQAPAQTQQQQQPATVQQPVQQQQQQPVVQQPVVQQQPVQQQPGVQRQPVQQQQQPVVQQPVQPAQAQPVVVQQQQPVVSQPAQQPTQRT